MTTPIFATDNAKMNTVLLLTITWHVYQFGRIHHYWGLLIKSWFLSATLIHLKECVITYKAKMMVSGVTSNSDHM